MSAPPRECPCGRPRSGGTMLEVFSGVRGRDLVRVLYLHPDGQCEWGRHLGPRPYWSRIFTSVAA